MSDRYNSLIKILQDTFNPKYLHIENESYKHRVPSGAESHFKIVIAAKVFNNLALVKRHQLIYAALKAHFSEGLHALSINAYGEDENIALHHTPDCANKKV